MNAYNSITPETIQKDMRYLQLLSHSFPTIADASTEIERIASLKASAPLAINELDLMARPFFLTYRPSVNLTIIPVIRIIIVAILYSTSSGVIIFLMDSTKAVIPA